jgi:hypothetical protein
MDAAFSAPYKTVNGGLSPGELEPDPVGIRRVPISKEMTDMMDLPCEDWMHEITVSGKVDDALFDPLQNDAGWICGKRGAGPNPIHSGLSPLPKMSLGRALGKELQSVMEDRFRTAHGFSRR